MNSNTVLARVEFITQAFEITVLYLKPIENLRTKYTVLSDWITFHCDYHRCHRHVIWG